MRAFRYWQDTITGNILQLPSTVLLAPSLRYVEVDPMEALAIIEGGDS